MISALLVHDCIRSESRWGWMRRGKECVTSAQDKKNKIVFNMISSQIVNAS